MKKFGRQQWKEAPVVPFVPLIASGMSLLGSIISRPGQEKTPEVSTPTVMPTEDSAATLDAKRRALQSQQQRGGRASTILSEDSTSNNTFGGN